MSVSDSLQESLNEENRVLQSLQEEMRQLREMKDALNNSVSQSDVDAEEGSGVSRSSEGSESQAEGDGVQHYTTVLGDLAQVLEDKVEAYIEVERERGDLINFIHQMSGRSTPPVPSEHEEASSSYRRLASMQKWMNRVSAVLDPNAAAAGAERQSDEEEKDASGFVESENQTVTDNLQSRVTTESVSNFSEQIDEDESEEEPSGNADLPTLQSQVDHAEEKGEPSDVRFADATPEQQAEMVEALAAMQTEMQHVQELQEQLAALEALQEQQSMLEHLQAQLQDVALAENTGVSNDAIDVVGSTADDADEPPSIAALQRSNDLAKNIDPMESSSGDAKNEEEDTPENSSDNLEEQNAVAQLEAKLAAVQQLQEMLESLSAEAAGAAVVDNDTTSDRIDERLQNGSPTQKQERNPDTTMEMEAIVDDEKIAELLELRQQLHNLQELQQHVLNGEAQLESSVNDNGGDNAEASVVNETNLSTDRDNELDPSKVAEIMALRQQLETLQQLEQEIAVMNENETDEATINDTLLRAQSVLQSVEQTSEEYDREKVTVNEVHTSDLQPRIPQIDDGTDDISNFNNMVDQLSPEEAQFLQTKVAEFEQAKRDAIAQHEELAALQHEYAQLQRLEQEQEALAKTATVIPENINYQNKAPVAKQPLMPENETIQDEEAQKAELLARLTVLHEEHRRMELERETLLMEAREHQLQEQKALLMEAEIQQREQQVLKNSDGNYPEQSKQGDHNGQDGDSNDSNDEGIKLNQDDIGGGMDDLNEDDGEFDEAEARATLAYLEQQFVTLRAQRDNLQTVISEHQVQAGAAGSEQLTKMRATLSRVEALISNIRVYHSFLSRRCEQQ